MRVVEGFCFTCWQPLWLRFLRQVAFWVGQCSIKTSRYVCKLSRCFAGATKRDGRNNNNQRWPRKQAPTWFVYLSVKQQLPRQAGCRQQVAVVAVVVCILRLFWFLTNQQASSGSMSLSPSNHSDLCLELC